MIIYILAFLLGFFLCILICPLVINFGKKLKFGQNILHYVESHSGKQGTPTMGGVSFIFAACIASLLFINESFSFAAVILSVFFAYGVLGFLDDFIKIKFKRNLGLRAYQKVIGQVSISLIVAIFVYLNPLIPNAIIVPFSNITIQLDFFIIPFIVLLFLAATNSVNLTDGLDGLAGGTSMIYFLGFAVISLLYIQGFTPGADAVKIAEYTNVVVICLAISGSLLGFLVFNSHPAKVFMGDTGSLALGALVAATASVNGLSLYILLIGVMFVLSSLSVIIQVLYFKKTKGKRVFLMAPLHHHFEKKGVHENKIVAIYIIVTVVLSLICILLTLIGNP